jgi:hypothetical protein
MAFFFGDSWDLYAQITDCSGYWDATFGGTATLALSSSGRFAGSRGLAGTAANGIAYISKTSGQNDSIHHLSIAVQQVPALSGTFNGFWITFYDGATAQCSVAFRSDGAIILAAGAQTGTNLATYTGAITAINAWYQFEIEVVINSTVGSIAVRKLGNTSNDFFLGNLNTRASANNYANKIGIGSAWGANPNHIVDDFLWRSDAASVSWAGDIRCFTRMPASDVSAQFTRSGSIVPVTPYVGSTTTTATTSGNYARFVASCDGTIGSAVLNFSVVVAASLKCTIFADNAGAVGAVLGSATILVNPTTGANTVTFGTPVAVTRGTTYWLGFCWNTSGASYNSANTQTANVYGTGASGITYASFPTANPSLSLTFAPIFTVNITPTTLSNAGFVADAATDYAGGYDFSSTVGQSDLYAITSIGSTPSSIIGVTTRVYAQKSDAGTRILAVQLQSGATNVQTTGVLNTNWNWIARNDLVDPATGAAWTAVGVNNAQIGVVVNT